MPKRSASGRIRKAARDRLVRVVRDAMPPAPKPVSVVDPAEKVADVAKLYAIGEKLEQLKQNTMARWAYEQAVLQDPSSLPVDLRLLDSEPNRFMYRRTMARFVTRNLDAIQAAAEKAEFNPDADPKVYVFWEQGFDDAPPIVRTCRTSLEQVGAEVVEVNGSTLSDLVDIPDDLQDVAKKNQAHFSDLVRMAILAKHGGIWVDATCFLTGNPLEHFDKLTPSGFFAYRYHGAHISNWFLMSRPGNDMSRMLYAGLAHMWRTPGIKLNYFWFHQLFESLVYLDPACGDVWNGAPDLSSKPPHALQFAMQEPYSPERFTELTDDSFVHKLTYKRTAEPGSILEHLEGASGAVEQQA